MATDPGRHVSVGQPLQLSLRPHFFFKISKISFPFVFISSFLVAIAEIDEDLFACVNFGRAVRVWSSPRMAAKTMMMRKEATAQGNGAAVQPPPPTAAKMNEVMFAKCECCGLTEECTEAYVAKVRERNQGRWICGLCAEAVKDEMARSSSERRIGSEEALNRHMTFCKKFKAQRPPPSPTEDLILAVKQLLLRSLDSPRSSPVKKQGLLRSQSCFSSIDG
nr:uncharacterized protein LOC109189306 [Ipomoea batatas]